MTAHSEIKPESQSATQAAPTHAAIATPKYPVAKLIARVVVPLVLLGTTAALLVWTGYRSLETLPTVAVTPVTLIQSDTPKAARKSAGLQAPGWIEPMPYAIEIPALREGVVRSIHALEGERVEAGALLITLESRAQEIACEKSRAELRAAQAEVDAKNAARDAAILSLALAIDSERALKNALAALSEARGMLAKLAPEIAESAAMAKEARDEFTRKQRLVDTGSASEGEVRRLGFRADALEAKAHSIELERTVREAKLAAAQADADAAAITRERRIAEHLEVSLATAAAANALAMRDARQAMLDEALLALERSQIHAPLAGVVLTRLARPGARVGGDAGALLTLYDPMSLQVRCDVPLKDAGKLMVGLTAEVRVDALPDRVFTGKVVRIVPQGDLQKNTVQCKVAIDSPDPALRPDMLARVRINESLTESGVARGEVTAIPSAALREVSDDRTTASVVIAIPDANAARTELRHLQLGAERASGWIEVLEGLHAGDRVVLDAAIAADVRILPLEELKGETP